MTGTNAIQERIKNACNDEEKARAYYLRQIVANYIDGSGGGKPSKNSDGRYPDVSIEVWEEGRSNFISNNTHVTIEGLTYNKPDFNWTAIPDEKGRGDLIGSIRKSYFFWLWDILSLEEAYRMKTFDMISLGEGNMGAFVRGDGVDVEWCDYMHVDWDPAYKEPEKRRYVIYEKSLPLREAIKFYPKIESLQLERIDDKTMDKLVWVKCYWDKDEQTEAVQFKRTIVKEGNNRYGKNLPIRATRLANVPGVTHSSGLVERQLGSQELRLRLRRHFRSVAVSATPMRFIAGNISDNDALQRVEEGDESAILRLSVGSQAGVTKGAEIQRTAIELEGLLAQDMESESATNSIRHGQTDANIDFASQLGALAQSSSTRERYMSQRIEEGIRDDIQKLIMPICSEFETREIVLNIDGQTIKFGGLTPINPILGSDGNLVMKPGGMAFRSSAQQLQETMILANVLQLTMGLPPGLQERATKLALQAAEVEDSEAWILDMQAGIEQMKMEQQAMMEQEAELAEKSKSSGSKPASPKPAQATA